ncbi:hypothetical protein MLD38_026276 [Melastoma candidum]|uniref:Uncharacterized protein n=1 Tax=Melastoma candidum TaxID=119954 RepID=A0ACB9NZ00_9MYRT|nr:hypothetical protein MLD38_026276 [Melastoma candidum]
MTSALDNAFASVIKECLSTSFFNAVKMLGLLAWTVHYRMSKECQSVKSWKSLFENNGIMYRRPDMHPASHDDDMDRRESLSDLDEEQSLGTRRKKKVTKGMKKKKTKRKPHHDDSPDMELLSFDFLDDASGAHYQSTSWLLPTDDFCTSWTNADLPEHLATYCFSVWMKQLYDKRRDMA